jgi:hypothetical protein
VPAVTLVLHLPGALCGGRTERSVAGKKNIGGLRCGWFWGGKDE